MALFHKLTAQCSVNEARSLVLEWTERTLPKYDVGETGSRSSRPQVEIEISSPRIPETHAVQPVRYTSTIIQDKVHSSIDAPSSAKEWDYSKRTYSCPGSEWHDITKFESSLPPSSSGFTVSNIGVSDIPALAEYITRGSLRSQQPFLGEHGMLVVEEDIKLLGETNKTFHLPSFPPLDDYHDGTELDQIFESLVAECASDNSLRYEYLNAMAHEPAVRETLGLPGTGLHPGNRLLSSKKHFPGIHSPYFYLSKGKSFFHLHREDCSLRSANILHKGAPKLWTMIDPKSKDRLEGKVLEALNIRSTICDQFIRHRNLIIPPAILRKWGISFKLILQKPGDIVTVRGDTYHYGINLGSNLAEAINYATADYDPPGPLCAPCSRKTGWCPLNDPILPSDLERDELRPLNIDIRWEYGALAKVTPAKVATQARTRRQLKRPANKRIRNPTDSQKRVVTRSKVAIEQASTLQSGPLPRMNIRHRNSGCSPVEQEQSGIESSGDETAESSPSLGSNLSASNGSSPVTAVCSSVELSTLPTASSTEGTDTHSESDLSNRAAASDASESHSPILTEADQRRTSTDTGFTPSSTTPAILDLQTSSPVDLLQADPSDSGADKQSDLDRIEDPDLLAEETAFTAGNHANVPDFNRETGRGKVLDRTLTIQRQGTPGTLPSSPTKRSCYFEDADINEYPHKRPRSLSGDVDIESELEDHRQHLTDLGPEWVQFYNTYVSKGKLEAVRIYDVLVLISTLGSPSVLLDIADLCQSKSSGFLSIKTSSTGEAYHLYRAYEAKGITLQIQKDMISMDLYRQFESSFEKHKVRLQNKNAIRSHVMSQNTRSENKSPVTLALDELVASCLEISVDALNRNPDHYQRDRRKITKIKNDGKKMSNFNYRIQSEMGITTLWTLLPLSSTRSTLDENRNVTLDQ